MYGDLKRNVNTDVFTRMCREFPYMLPEWDKQCKEYDNMTEEEAGDCGENLTRFQAAVFGAGETIEEYLDEL